MPIRMAKKKNKTELVLVGTMVPVPMSQALKWMAKNEDRSVSKIVKKVLEESPHVQAALKEIQAA